MLRNGVHSHRNTPRHDSHGNGDDRSGNGDDRRHDHAENGQGNRRKPANYQDSAALYEERYGWKVTVLAINSNPDDTTTNCTSLSYYNPIYFHLRVTGGEPGATLTMKRVISYPDGETRTSEWDGELYNGDTTWFGWTDGMYDYPSTAPQGTLTVKFYTGNELLSQGSVRLTDDP